LWNNIRIQKGDSTPIKHHRQTYYKALNTNKMMALEGTIQWRQNNDCQKFWPKPSQLLSAMLWNEKKDIIKVESRIFKFLWNKKWQCECPDRVKRQTLKNSYKYGVMKAPDIAALDCALKVKQFINATKFKIKIKAVQ
jgi:hypothetical protein